MRSNGRVTVARVDPPLPSTAPDFVHVTLDSSGSYKDVPMDQLYTIFLDAHGRWTENDGCRAQGAQMIGRNQPLARPTTETEASRESMSTLGISWKSLESFRDQHISDLHLLTTSDVRDLIIKRSTAQQKCSYADLHPEMFGPANVFVSHAWMYLFVDDLIGGIEVWISQQEDCPVGGWRFWIDLFVVNQHLDPPRLADARVEEENFQVFTKEFEGALLKIGRALVVLSPWDRPHWIFRIWCLFEFYAIMKFGIRYEFVLPQQQNSAFVKSLGEEGNKFLDLVSQLDMEKADASRDYGKMQIKALVLKGLGGYSKLNESVIGAIRLFSVDSSLRELQTMNQDQKSRNNLLENTALLLVDVGELGTALKLFSESLAIKVRCFGTRHVSVAATYNNMGIVYETQGDYKRALFHYQNALDMKIKSLGGAHVSVAATYGNIGNVLESQGKFDEALKMHQKCLEIEERALGPSHVSSARTRVNMGSVHQSLGDCKKALSEYTIALPILEAALGPSHVSVADTKMKIGTVHWKRGDQGTAKHYYREAHGIYLKSLGADHPKTKALAPYI